MTDKTTLKERRTPLTPILLWSALFTAVTGLILGYDLCIVASLLQPIDNDLGFCGVKKSSSSSSTKAVSSVPDLQCINRALFVSIVSPGAAVGSLLGGWFSDAFGRVKTLMAGDIFTVVGALLFYFAGNFVALIFGRVFIGVGIGVGFVVFSTYMSEIAPADRRGQLIAAQECAVCAGCLISYAIVAIIPTSAWRTLLGAVGIVAFLQFFGAFFLPESPRWLVRRGRSPEALETLRRLHKPPQGCCALGGGNLSAECDSPSKLPSLLVVPQVTAVPEPCEDKEAGLPCTPSAVRPDHDELSLSTDDSLKMIVQQMEIERRADSKKQSLRRRRIEMTVRKESAGPSRQSSPVTLNSTDSNVSTTEEFHSSAPLVDVIRLCWSNLSSLAIALGCAFGQNLTMSNSVLYFSGDILAFANIHNTALAGVLIGAMKLAGVVTVIFIVERIGRKKPLLTGSIITCINHILFAILFALNKRDENPSSVVGAIILANLLIYIFAWNFSWASLMFVVASEVLPSSIRGLGMGLTITLFWMLAFLFQTTLEATMAALTISGAFALYACLNFLSILFVVLCVKDHTGKTLEEINARSKM